MRQYGLYSHQIAGGQCPHRYMARRAADFGVIIDGPVAVDMKKVKEREDDVVGRSNHEIPDWMKKMSNILIDKNHDYDTVTLNVT